MRSDSQAGRRRFESGRPLCDAVTAAIRKLNPPDAHAPDGFFYATSCRTIQSRASAPSRRRTLRYLRAIPLGLLAPDSHFATVLGLT